MIQLTESNKKVLEKEKPLKTDHLKSVISVTILNLIKKNKIQLEREKEVVNKIILKT